ncbi:MAG: aldo/keto reductase [Pseudomonadales bacterium]
MKTRRIGQFDVAEIGLGGMVLSHAYNTAPSEEQGIELLHAALDMGVTHFDTASLYGFGRNETLLGKAFKGLRDRIHLASKCGMGGVDGKRVIDGRPETLLKTIEESLTRLQTDHIDLYYLHRWDKSVPIEDSMGALAQMVEQGKIGAVGLSEVSSNTLRKAHAVHPVAALQNEYSLWVRNPEIALLEACEELDVALVAYCPLARGFLAGNLEVADGFADGDIRRGMPRFNEPHFSNNVQWLGEFKAIAAELECTPGQLALHWLLRKRPYIIPIPGTRSVSHLQENIAASQLNVPQDTLDRVECLVNQNTVSGPRYPQPTQNEIDTEQFEVELEG